MRGKCVLQVGGEFLTLNQVGSNRNPFQGVR